MQMLPGNGKLDKDILGRRSTLSCYYCCIELMPNKHRQCAKAAWWKVEQGHLRTWVCIAL